ncbi:MAG: hypothetical protein LBM93_15400 [Oscillospiraceae bacterium]|jgi:hypothetical protein|nr:hypothetical protein [Oscillospiraceae bacterium]
MKKRNKFITICLIFIFTFSFTSCNINVDEEKIKENVEKFFEERPDKQGYISTHSSAKEEFLKISEYLDRGDPTFIKEFISEDVSEEKIAEMLELWEGTLVSNNDILETNGGGYKAKGEYTELIIRPRVRNIETTETINNDYYYEVGFCYIIVDEDKDKEGLWLVVLEKFKGEEKISSVYTGEAV